MKIFHITHTDILFDNRILKELSSLSEVDTYEVFGTGVTLEEGAAETEEDYTFEVRSINLRTGKLKWLPRPLRYALMATELTLSIVKQGVSLRPKVVHCHDTLVLAAGLLIKLFTGAKLVYDAHELESSKKGQTLVLSKATLFLEKACWRSIDLLISVSPSIINWYNNHLGHKASVLILNSPWFQGEEKKQQKGSSAKTHYFHQRYEIPSDRLIFIYVGLLVKGRGIESIISAFRDYEINSHVVFVGYGDLSEEINKIASFSANIHLHPPVPHEKVVSLVSNADVGLCLIEDVSLSDYYCLPNKLFEYGFAGIPILGSKFPDIEEYVNKYGLGYCCDNDATSIVKAIRKIELGNTSKGVMQDLSELNWKAQEERLIAAYSHLLTVDK